MVEIHGSTDPRFAGVRDAFAANFAPGRVDGGDIGASVCVTLPAKRSSTCGPATPTRHKLAPGSAIPSSMSIRRPRR